jgi:hypothetical protein
LEAEKSRTATLCEVSIAENATLAWTWSKANNIVDGAIVVDQSPDRMNRTTRNVYPVLKASRDKKTAR